MSPLIESIKCYLCPNDAISGVGMGMGFAPTWLRQVSPPPCLLHKTTLTTDYRAIVIQKISKTFRWCHSWPTRRVCCRSTLCLEKVDHCYFYVNFDKSGPNFIFFTVEFVKSKWSSVQLHSTVNSVQLMKNV